MKQLVLVRHGQSTWNLQNRFTGWVDVDLSERGVNEARDAGRTLKARGYRFDLAMTSFLQRSIHTLELILEEMGQMSLPVQTDWRLNERHYGALQGLDKRKPQLATVMNRYSSGAVGMLCVHPHSRPTTHHIRPTIRVTTVSMVCPPPNR